MSLLCQKIEINNSIYSNTKLKKAKKKKRKKSNTPQRRK